jgi:hypothetical protein
MKLGIISDTHGVLHPAVPDIFQGVSQIVHAGDVGDLKVIIELERIAPVIGVRGNYDASPELVSRLLPDPSAIRVAGLPALLTHRMFTMGWDETKEYIASLLSRGPNPVKLVIFGHTHFPVLELLSGIWFVNPGYAGPDPLEGPLTAAVIEIQGQSLAGEIVSLDQGKGPAGS